MLFVVDPVDLVFMSTAKSQFASCETIIYRIDVCCLYRIVLVRDIHELDGIAIPAAIVTVDGIDNVSLLFHGTAICGEDQGIGPRTEDILASLFFCSEDSLNLYFILGERLKILDGEGTGSEVTLLCPAQLLFTLGCYLAVAHVPGFGLATQRALHIGTHIANLDDGKVSGCRIVTECELYLIFVVVSALVAGVLYRGWIQRVDVRATAGNSMVAVAIEVGICQCSPSISSSCIVIDGHDNVRFAVILKRLIEIDNVPLS